MEWQPIETAPHGDIVDLWVWDPLGPGPSGGCRIVECEILPDGSDALGPTGTLIGADECLCFSHWMPLPAPPLETST